MRYRRVGSELYKEANTTSNLTEIVLIDLVVQSTYEIEVNGFNENGQGPRSQTLVIKTLSLGKLVIQYVLFE